MIFKHKGITRVVLVVAFLLAVIVGFGISFFKSNSIYLGNDQHDFFNTSNITPTLTSTNNDKCAQDGNCDDGYFCDYSYQCPKGFAPNDCGYVGSGTCIQKCADDSDCFGRSTCTEYEIWQGDSGSIIKGCKAN